MFRRRKPTGPRKKKKKPVAAANAKAKKGTSSLSRPERKANEVISIDSSGDDDDDDDDSVEGFEPTAKKSRVSNVTSLGVKKPPAKDEKRAALRDTKRTARKSVSTTHKTVRPAARVSRDQAPRNKRAAKNDAFRDSSSSEDESCKKPAARSSNVSRRSFSDSSAGDDSPPATVRKRGVARVRSSSQDQAAAARVRRSSYCELSSSEEDDAQASTPLPRTSTAKKSATKQPSRARASSSESSSIHKKPLVARPSDRTAGPHGELSTAEKDRPLPSKRVCLVERTTEKAEAAPRKRERVAEAAGPQHDSGSSSKSSDKKKKRVAPILIAAAASLAAGRTLISSTPPSKKRSRSRRNTPEVLLEDDDVRPSSPIVFLSEDEPATPDILASHCWRCKCRVKEVDGKPSFYAMHVHPLLHVPCCSVCCEIAAAIEIPIDQEDVDVCSVCGDGGDALLLCDGCPHAFCRVCTAQAWGGGKKGLRKVDYLTNDSDRSWTCIVCLPPNVLTKLRIEDATLLGKSDDDGGAAKKSGDTVEQIVEKLTKVEDELNHYQTMILTEANMEAVEKEVRQELAEQETDEELLNEQVEEEMSTFQEKQQWHYDLLQDQKVDLLERLNAFEISDDMFYKYYDTEDGKANNTENSDLDWKQKADLFNDRRESKEREAIRQSRHETSSDDDESDREREALKEVEDLCTSAEPEEWETEDVVNNRKVWKNDNHSREWLDKKLTKYMKNDNEMLKKARSRLTKVDTANDENESHREFTLSSVTSRDGGRTTIRRDELIQTMKVRKKHKPAVAIREKKASDKISNYAASRSRSGSPALSTPGRKSPKIATPFRTQINGQRTRSINAKDKAANGDAADDLIDDVPELKAFVGDKFWNSCTELSSEQDGGRTVRIAVPLASQLKPHQVEGVKFLWQNSCKDLSSVATHDQVKEEKDVGGCICAHMMGLGKSLQVVTLVHTLFNHPNLRPQEDEEARQFIHTVLLVVPVNTIANWKNEFERWTDKLEHTVRVFDVSEVKKEARLRMIRTWSDRGGVLLIGSDLYSNLLKKNDCLSKHFQNPGPDMVIIDEAHTLLKKASSQIAARLGPIRTKRRIILSGTPFVNNLKEYFQLVDWVRPGIFGTATSFDRRYVKPITAGLSSDSTIEAVALQVQRSKQLFADIAPFMQRRDISILKRDLPPCQTVVFYIRQSKLQTRLYRRFDQFAKKLKQSGEEMPFITQYQTLRPLHNHPYCLVQSALGIRKRGSIRKEQQRKIEAAANAAASAQMENASETKSDHRTNEANEDDTIIDLMNSDSEERLTGSGRISPLEPDSEEGKVDAAPQSSALYLPAKNRRGKKPMDFSWMENVLKQADDKKIEAVKHGHKILLLLQIVANAQSVGDKVIVFSQCLKTLDFIEQVLHTNWAQFCEGHEKNKNLGMWRKGVDYLRIDGSVNSSERGELVSSFHKKFESHKLFLLSIEAGGIGINLVAANRVVLFDNHWNPTVSSQAFHRCYRYGQEKPVYGYRFVTEGSMEEKIFSRSMNKSGIAARVIDLQFPERLFSERELAEIKSTDVWVQCNNCDKWRMLFFESEEDLPENWYCTMNADPFNKVCGAQERDAHWYERHRLRIMNNINQNVDEKMIGARDSVDPGNSDKADAAKEAMVKKDGILMSMGVLGLFENTKAGEKIPTRGIANRVISKIEFQEMLQVESADLEIEASHREAEAAAAKEAAAVAAKLAVESSAREAMIREANAAAFTKAAAMATSRPGAAVVRAEAPNQKPVPTAEAKTRSVLGDDSSNQNADVVAAMGAAALTIAALAMKVADSKAESAAGNNVPILSSTEIQANVNLTTSIMDKVLDQDAPTLINAHNTHAKKSQQKANSDKDGKMSTRRSPRSAPPSQAEARKKHGSSGAEPIELLESDSDSDDYV